MMRTITSALLFLLQAASIVGFSFAGGAPPVGNAIAASQATSTAASVERIAINDNRRTAGTLAGNVLTVQLEARLGEWHPEGDDEPGVVVKAFSIEGGPLQVPGPLLRLPEGTEVRASIRNRTAGPLTMHGLFTRPARAADARPVVTIAPGDVQEIRFNAGSPGTYFYWAGSAADGQMDRDTGIDSQLAGAFVVDPRGGSTPDRVFVLSSWRAARTVDGQDVFVGRFLINGKSWPNTERLTYDVGDTVRFRLVNIGISVHPMHLHGFYYNVDSRGNEFVDTIFPAASPHLVNTERLPTGQTFSLTWKPTRAGNWLFHCHDALHIVRQRYLDGRLVMRSDHAGMDHGDTMAGPVVGITVRPKGGEVREAEPAQRRRLRLVARVDQNGTDDEPAYGFTLEENGKTNPSAPPYLPGPTIVLKKGEPVAIDVENRLPESTSVHWHGIELESYYDGVPGFAGNGTQLAPAIEPGKTFEARFTPPRSGTFIYHTHLEEMRQQQAGLTGALLIVDSPASYDPATDWVMLVTSPRRIADDNVVWLNGTSTPAARTMRVGLRYRLRFINMHTSRPNMIMRIQRGDTVQTWRALAKDGLDLPSEQAVAGQAQVQMGNGETYDFEFTPTEPGDLRVAVSGGQGVLLVSMPIKVN
jgi:FtsP/CotA-like multicopper oxidase with cupredoxin domain